MSRTFRNAAVCGMVNLPFTGETSYLTQELGKSGSELPSTKSPHYEKSAHVGWKVKRHIMARKKSAVTRFKLLAHS